MKKLRWGVVFLCLILCMSNLDMRVLSAGTDEAKTNAENEETSEKEGKVGEDEEGESEDDSDEKSEEEETQDLTAPSITVVFQNVCDYYLPNTQTMYVTITDENLDMENTYLYLNRDDVTLVPIEDTEYTETTTTVTDEGGNTETITKREYTGLFSYMVYFESDGVYFGKIIARDRAGNESEYVIDEFCIDMTPPKIDVEIDYADELYTNRLRLAHIHIEDENLLGEKDFEYEFSEGEDYVEVVAKDLAGNMTRYESDTYIQDYTSPEVNISGIENGGETSGKLSIDVDFSDDNADISRSVIYIQGKNGVSYFFRADGSEESYGMSLEDYEGLPDDYYKISYEAYDLAGNVSEGEHYFTINRNGSTFELSESLKSARGKYVSSLENVSITERNLSPSIEGSTRFIITRNARVIEPEIGKDIIIEKRETPNGYETVYLFDSGLFEENGVYTISLANDDSAGNYNDTRFYDKSEDIVFGIRKEETVPVTESVLSEENNSDNENVNVGNEEIVSEGDSSSLPGIIAVCALLSLAGVFAVLRFLMLGKK